MSINIYVNRSGKVSYKCHKSVTIPVRNIVRNQ